jgi:hypothetical protein
MNTTNKQQIQLEELKLKCPLCGTLLASDNYNRAINELKNKAEAGFENQRIDYENKIKLIEESQKKQLQEMKNFYASQYESLKLEIKNANVKQLRELKQNYENNNRIYKEESEKSIAESRLSFDKELQTVKFQLKEAKLEQLKMKELGLQEGKMTAKQDMEKLRNEIMQKNIQLERLSLDLEKLKTQTSKTQSELKGEAGERDLFSQLGNAFPGDILERQKRGTSSGDIIQRIKLNDTILDCPIVFDNKESQAVTKSDVEKAKKYKYIHETNYVIIVSEILPKECGEGVIGERDGILIVHPTILIEFMRQFRKFVIDLYKERLSHNDRASKEAHMFAFITSQSFGRLLNSLYEIYKKERDLQVKEERDHNSLWKSKTKLTEQLKEIYMEIAGEIDSIVQENVSNPSYKQQE